MSAKAVTCCIRIFEVLEGTDILNADILDMLASTLMDDFASTSFAIPTGYCSRRNASHSLVICFISIPRFFVVSLGGW